MNKKTLLNIFAVLVGAFLIALSYEFAKAGDTVHLSNNEATGQLMWFTVAAMLSFSGGITLVINKLRELISYD